MLADCLQSIGKLHIPSHLMFHVIVVDNDPLDARVQANALSPLGDLVEAHLVSETRKGIPFARNKAIETALAVDADWIGFVDDDETVDAQWLTEMCKAIACYQPDVIQGSVQYQYPNTVPDWLPLKSSRSLPDGKILKSAATNNVLARRDLFSEDALWLRFDTSRPLAGGTDTLLFGRAAKYGVKIIAYSNAKVCEVVIASRLTLNWQLKRACRVESNNAQRSLKINGIGHTLIRMAPKAITRFIRGLIYATLLPFWRLSRKARQGKAWHFTE